MGDNSNKENGDAVRESTLSHRNLNFTTLNFGETITPRPNDPTSIDPLVRETLVASTKNLNLCWITPDHFSKFKPCFESGKELFLILLENSRNNKQQRNDEENADNKTPRFFRDVREAEIETSSESEQEEEMNTVEKFFPQDFREITANGIAFRNNLDIVLRRELSKTDNPHLEFIAFLENKYKRMRRVVRLYKSHRYTIKLQAIDAEMHWSTERLSREDHNERFTRRDAAMAEAWADDAKAELHIIKEGGTVGIRGDEVSYCKVMCEIFEDTVGRDLEVRPEDTGDKFCFWNFALADILERQHPANDGFFTKAISKIFAGSRKDGIKRLLSGPRIWRDLKAILIRHGIQWQPIYQDLQEIVEKNLTLPKGKLYCRLLLNVAALTFFDVKWNVWRSQRMSGHDLERKIFQGIPFNSQGHAFTFAVQSSAPEPAVR